MDFITWLDQEDGRAAAVAAHFNVSRSAVSQWRTNGVPLAKMKALREFTQNEVTLDAMVPEADKPATEDGQRPFPSAAEATAADSGEPALAGAKA